MKNKRFNIAAACGLLFVTAVALSLPATVQAGEGWEAETERTLERLDKGKNWDRQWVKLLDYHFNRKSTGDNLDAYTLEEVKAFRAFLVKYPYAANRPRFCEVKH